MRAYYLDNLPGDQRFPHDSSRPVDAETLHKIKVEFWHIPIDEGHAYEEELNRVAKKRGYKNRDEISISKEGLGEVSC